MSSRPTSMPARPVGERSQISAEDLKNHTPLKKAETKENTKLPDSDGKLKECVAGTFCWGEKLPTTFCAFNQTNRLEIKSYLHKHGQVLLITVVSGKQLDMHAFNQAILVVLERH